MLIFITIYRPATSKIDSSKRAGNVAGRIFDLIAQKTNVVVAPVIVGRDQHRAAQAVEKSLRKCKCARQENRMPAPLLKWVSPAKMIQPIVPITTTHSTFREPADRGDSPVQQKHRQQARCRRRRRFPALTSQLTSRLPTSGMCAWLRVRRSRSCSSPGQKYAGIFRQADAAGRNREGRAEGQLPDEEKRNQPSRALLGP